MWCAVPDTAEAAQAAKRVGHAGGWGDKVKEPGAEVLQWWELI